MLLDKIKPRCNDELDKLPRHNHMTRETEDPLATPLGFGQSDVAWGGSQSAFPSWSDVEQGGSNCMGLELEQLETSDVNQRRLNQLH
jgi:hypothetical protein